MLAAGLLYINCSNLSPEVCSPAKGYLLLHALKFVGPAKDYMLLHALIVPAGASLARCNLSPADQQYQQAHRHPYPRERHPRPSLRYQHKTHGQATPKVYQTTRSVEPLLSITTPLKCGLCPLSPLKCGCPYNQYAPTGSSIILNLCTWKFDGMVVFILPSKFCAR